MSRARQHPVKAEHGDVSDVTRGQEKDNDGSTSGAALIPSLDGGGGIRARDYTDMFAGGSERYCVDGVHPISEPNQLLARHLVHDVVSLVHVHRRRRPGPATLDLRQAPPQTVRG